MNELELVAIVIVLIYVACLTARRRGTAPAPLQRLHPGVVNRAEWMAPRETIQCIEADYLAAQQWALETLLTSYPVYLRELPHYFSGQALTEQVRIVAGTLQRRGPRLVGALRAHHQLQVRRFAEDGMSCCLLDHQSERRMATYDYWTKRRLHTQDLGSGVYVYLMVYDPITARWKIARLIQQLPAGWESGGHARIPIRLTHDLPVAAGRDL
ncbi:MAG: hypothetical protein ACYDBJ_22415 [Aggregatilineales bacterium]